MQHRLPAPSSPPLRPIPQLIDPNARGSDRFLLRRTVTLGMHNGPAGYHIKGSGRVKFLPSAVQMFAATPVARTMTPITIVLASVADLNLPKGGTTADITEQAWSQELTICPAEAALALRLDYAEQPPNDWIAVAMTPIIINGEPQVYCLGCNELVERGSSETRRSKRKSEVERVLCGMPCGPLEWWPPDMVFAFMPES